MNLVDLSRENFSEAIARDGIVIVDCHPSWSGSQGQFSPVYHRVASLYPQHTFARLDIRTESPLTRMLGVGRRPALLLFRRGVLLFAQNGPYTESTLIDMVEQTQAIDMRLVLKEITHGRPVESRPAYGNRTGSVN